MSPILFPRNPTSTEISAIHLPLLRQFLHGEPIDHRPWLSSPLDDGDPLSEILCRLPPRPSSLPQASLVCKRWRELATSPQFLRDFRRVFHRMAAPLLGFFHNTNLGAPDRRFVAAADPPDRVPAALFRMPCGRNHKEWRFLDCRHGRALLIGSVGPRREVLVWDPMTGVRRCTPVPPDAGDVRHGAVLCSCGLARDCRSSPFGVVLIWWIGTRQHWRVAAAIYSSESDAWSHVISVETQVAATVLVTQRNAQKPDILVGDAVYWLLPERHMNGSSSLTAAGWATWYRAAPKIMGENRWRQGWRGRKTGG